MAQQNSETQEKIIPRVIEEEMKQSYLAYSMSVIVGRALPDVRDGLKPVHRRVLYAMYDMGLVHNKPFKKSARVVGEVLGKYHPHGDLAVYEALVRMAQDFSLRYPLIQGQGNFGCFTKETKVRLADGRSLSFAELVEEASVGKRNFTFTVNSEGNINIAEIKKPRLTRKNAPLVKVVLDNGKEMRCTPNHKFMLLDGSYKEAQDLKRGESLLPGYFRFSQKEDNPNAVGYEMIFQPMKKVWSYEHHLADEWNLQNKVYSVRAGRVRHHMNFVKSNNNPTNITRLYWGSHLTLHALHAGKLHESEEYRKKIAAGRSAFWSSASNKKAYGQLLSERNKKQWQDPVYRKHMRDILSRVNKKYLAAHPEKIKEFSKRASVTLRRLWKEPEYRQLFHNKIAASNKRRITNNTGKVKFLRICHETLASYRVLNEKAYETTRQERFGASFTTWKKGFKKYFESNISAVYDEVCYNHKIINIKHLKETEDVYDLTIEGTHNFLLDAGVFVHNSVDGDGAAAMRYTECRLSPIAHEVLEDLDKETVKFLPNFDNSLTEPEVLPGKVPLLLLNGSSGIAVGMATNMPPHNLRELCSAITHVIDNPNVSAEALMQFIPAPDFPTGGIICGTSGVKEAYASGRGKVLVRANVLTEEVKGRTRLVVREIPYMVNKALLVEQIADLIRERRVVGITDLRDESDREGIRVVLELKHGQNAEVVLNQLFAHSRLQESFSIILLSIVGKTPKVCSLPLLINEFVEHRKIVVRKRTEFDLRKAQERCHLLEGILVALQNIDAVIVLIKESKTPEDARVGLMSVYSMSELQARAVLDTKLQRLTSLEQGKIKEEHAGLLIFIGELQAILASEPRILGIIKEELSFVSKTYGDDRRSRIASAASDIDDEALIKREDVVVTLTHRGYVKRLPVDTYKAQRRGGKGIVGTETKEEDFVERLFVANTHDFLLCFTSLGKIHWLKVHQVPDAGRYAAGTPLPNMLSLDANELVTALIAVKEFGSEQQSSQFLFFVTAKGIVKRTGLAEFSNPRKGGILAIGLDGDDRLVNVLLTKGNEQVILASADGMAVKFLETDVREMGRTAYGVYGIRLKEGDVVVGASLAHDNKSLLTVTELGFGKRSPIEEYRLINRGGVGVINIKITEKNGRVACVREVDDATEVLFVSQEGIMLRILASQVNVIGRNTQGVRIMRLGEKDKLVALAAVENGE